MMSKPCPRRPELEALLKAAIAKGPMTREEVEAQRRSWVIGNLMLDHPEWTREYAEQLYDRAIGL